VEYPGKLCDIGFETPCIYNVYGSNFTLRNITVSDKTKYMVMSRDRNAGRCHGVKIDNRSIERVEEFKYLGATLTDQNSMQE
jgi:methyl coenzyme M reductase subunit D